jgi:RNA polymerase sigma-70 factor (ECF subfamily)
MNEKISDQKIVRHYLDRLESAILETKNKYGKLINLIAYNILCSKDDADECENDTYLNVWNSIPPNEPENLKAYCLRISRNHAIKRYRYNSAQKRDNSKQLSLEKNNGGVWGYFPRAK